MFLFTMFLLNCCQSVTYRDPVTKEFRRFIVVFKRTYFSPDEYKYRYSVFRSNVLKMKKFDKNAGKLNAQILNSGRPTFKAKPWSTGLNHFFDLTDQEFQKYYLLPKDTFNRPTKSLERLKRGYIGEKGFDQSRLRTPNVGATRSPSPPKKKSRHLERFLQTTNPLAGFPRRVSWRRFATPIKDQMKCNSCYAFSAIGAVEMWHGILFRNVVQLSEQEILDCSRENYDCVGGQMGAVMDYIIDHHISFTPNYPYTGEKGRCAKNYYTPQYGRLRDFGYVRPNIISLIRQTARGPVSVAHHAPEPFKFYKDGVFTGDGCTGHDELNHSSVIIGYNLDAEIPYFEFKNSWSELWGTKGFYNMAIGDISFFDQGLCQLAAQNFNVVPIF